jgi:hypothetical protein|tara:strand:- start:619 stop:819 length:201 start_codon:yes stop_codon:yes gene_type:complete
VNREDLKIRATIEVELPYSNELINYGDKLKEEIIKVINNEHFSCKLETGVDLPITELPTIKKMMME